MTTVYNFIGGPGTGKSTKAAEFYAYLKEHGVNAELVPEAIKSLAWEGVERTPLRKLRCMLDQIDWEVRLYDKGLTAIVVDSPVVLFPLYEAYYTSMDVTKKVYFDVYLPLVSQFGVTSVYFQVQREWEYSDAGRWEDEKTSDAVHSFITENLPQYGVSPTTYRFPKFDPK